MQGRTKALLNTFRRPAQPFVLQLGRLRIIATVYRFLFTFLLLMRLREVSGARLGKNRHCGGGCFRLLLRVRLNRSRRPWFVSLRVGREFLLQPCPCSFACSDGWGLRATLRCGFFRIDIGSHRRRSGGSRMMLLLCWWRGHTCGHTCGRIGARDLSRIARGRMLVYCGWKA